MFQKLYYSEEAAISPRLPSTNSKSGVARRRLRHRQAHLRTSHSFFCNAIYEGEWKIQGETSRYVHTLADIEPTLDAGFIPILTIPDREVLDYLKPDVFVDATISKSPQLRHFMGAARHRTRPSYRCRRPCPCRHRDTTWTSSRQPDQRRGSHCQHRHSGRHRRVRHRPRPARSA